MKFTFHVSPNLQAPGSTQRIMRDLTLGLLIVFAASVIYYFTAYGANVGLQAIILLLCSLATTFVCEAIFAKIEKQNIKEFITHSFGWVTSLILVMMCSINITPCSLATTFVCEAIFAKIEKQNIKEFITHSFGWVTSLILVMMCSINITPYAIIIATLFAIVIGRLVFGGFGFNIYNPAAVGRAVIFASFSGATTRLPLTPSSSRLCLRS